MSPIQRHAADDLAIDAGAMFRALWAAKVWIVPLVIIAAIGTAAVLGLVTPLYKGEGRLLIEARDVPLRFEQRGPEQDRALLDQEGVASQVQVLTSRDLARRVIREEKLGDEREFVGATRSLLADLAKSAGLGRTRASASPEERYLEVFYERLAVFQVEKSRVIQVEFRSEDPDLAARVTNAVLREYMQMQAEAKQKTSSDTTRWLEGEIAALRGRVTEAESKVEAYRSSNGLFVATNNNTLVQQQLAELNTQITNASAARSDAEAKLQQVRRLVDTGAFDRASEVLAQPLFQRLREREVALKSRIAELSATYLPNHPQILGLQSQIRDIEAQIRAEVRKIVGALESDVRVADQRLRELRTQLGDFKAQASRANEEDIQLRALEREAKAQRELLETFLARYRENSARQNVDAQPADARVVSAATPPAQPYFPKIVPLTTIVTLATFLLGATFVVLRELVTGRALVATGTGAVAAAPVAPATAPSPDPGGGSDGPRGGGEPVPPAPRAEAPTGISAIFGRRPRPDAPIPPMAPVAPAAAIAPERPDAPGPSPARAALDAAMSGRDGRPDPATDDAPDATEPETSAEGEESPAVTDHPGAVWRRVTASAGGGRLVAVLAARDGDASRRAAIAVARYGAFPPAQVVLVSLSRGGIDLKTMTGQASPQGFCDLLAGRARFGEVIFRDLRSRLDLIGPGQGRPDMSRCRSILVALAASYDHVVLEFGALSEVEAWAVQLIGDADHVVVGLPGATLDPSTADVLSAFGHAGPGGVSLLSTAGLAAESEAAA
ncbi:exopolysaccharide transport family protein [Prosthecomicrobium sp. N25]|uniref:exopolysaccharide transport family protein n=1 Tax=Prosthecomicrobium sp. N25 TaxID=3129254 RepID=UPI003076C21A